MKYAERLAAAQRFYTEARLAGECNLCGKVKGEATRIGPHPEGKMGQPIRICGADIEKLKKWISEAGWVCRGCAVGGGGQPTCKSEQGGPLGKPRFKLPKGVPHESGAAYLRDVRRKYIAQYGLADWDEYSRQHLIDGGRWMEPEDFA